MKVKYIYIGQANWKNRLRGLTIYFTEALKVVIGIGIVVGLIIAVDLYLTGDLYTKTQCPRIQDKQLRLQTKC